MSENTISNIKVNGTSYAINDQTKVSQESFDELMSISNENKSSIELANNKLDDLLNKLLSSGGGSMDFYKCAAVHEAQAGGTCYIISGCPIEAANGTYLLTEYTTEYLYETYPVYSNGTYYYYFGCFDFVYSSSWNWGISTDYTGNLLYIFDGESWIYTDFNTIEGMTHTESTVAPSSATWDGYKAVFDAESEIWSFDAAVTTGLTFGNIVPAIGKIYNDTATITAVLYQGYPENALLINCDTLNDGRLTATNCTLSTDIKKYGTGSIKINSGGYIKFDHGAGNLTDIPWTVAHFFYADSYTGGSNIKALINNDDDDKGTFFVCIRTTGELCLHIRGGKYYETSNALTPGWHHIRVVHAGGGLLRAYLDGMFVLAVADFKHNTDSFWIGELGYLDRDRQFDGYIDGIEFIPLDESTIAEYSGDTAPVPANSF